MESEILEKARRVFDKLNLTEDEFLKNITLLSSGSLKNSFSFSFDKSHKLKSGDVDHWLVYFEPFRATPIEDQDQVYSLDQSSLFMISPVMLITNNLQSPITILDTCSAPGGKGLIAARILNPDRLVLNEKSNERFRTLKSNVGRLSLDSAVLYKSDIRDLGGFEKSRFSLVIVDGPCTGQSLYGKGMNNKSAFSAPQIRNAAGVQKKILLASLPFVKKNGYLIYSTCTFSIEENEKVVDWVVKKFPEFKTVEVPYLKTYRSRVSEEYCYRLMPADGVGAGGFTTLFVNS